MNFSTFKKSLKIINCRKQKEKKIVGFKTGKIKIHGSNTIKDERGKVEGYC